MLDEKKLRQRVEAYVETFQKARAAPLMAKASHLEMMGEHSAYLLEQLVKQQAFLLWLIRSVANIDEQEIERLWEVWNER